MRYFVLWLQLLLIVPAASCSSDEPEAASDASRTEAPFFVVDSEATGPLTLAELQIAIPREIDVWMTESRKSCFFDSVQRRALEAGDPAILEPGAFLYWDDEMSREDWVQLGNYMQRVLLAQAIISWAMIDC